MKTAVIILAAGVSRRMGYPKQLLPWGEELLVNRAVRVAETLGPVYVVVGGHEALVRAAIAETSAIPVPNAAFAMGMRSSICAGLTRVLGDMPVCQRILIILADQPWVDTPFLQKLLTVNGATDYGGKAGVPAVFLAPAFDNLLNAEGGAAGAKEILRATPGLTLVAPPTEPYDIDTPEDYARHAGDQEHN